MGLDAVEVGRPKAQPAGTSGGLYLFGRPSGQRYRRLVYRFGGTRYTMALGVYPDVSLTEARTKRDAIRETLADVTLKKQRRLLDFAYPNPGERPINRISAHELDQTPRTIEMKAHFETAGRLRGTCGQVFRYAVATGRAERDVCIDLRGALIPPTVTYLGAMTEPSEVGKLVRAIDRFDGYRVTHAALTLVPHLFVRPGELRPAEWSKIDFSDRVRAIPAKNEDAATVLRLPVRY